MAGAILGDAAQHHCSSGSLEMPGLAVSHLSPPTQLSQIFLASLAGKNNFYKSFFCPVSTTSSKCRGYLTCAVRKAGKLSCNCSMKFLAILDHRVTDHLQLIVTESKREWCC